MFAFLFGLAMTVMTAIASHFPVANAAAISAFGLATAAAALAFEELAHTALVQAASLRSTALIAAGMLAGVTADRADDQQQSAEESQGSLHDVPQDAVASGREESNMASTPLTESPPTKSAAARLIHRLED
jgi:hypothetical protein